MEREFEKLPRYMVPYFSPKISSNIQGVIAIALYFSTLKSVTTKVKPDFWSDVILALKIGLENVNLSGSEFYYQILKGLYYPYFQNISKYIVSKADFEKYFSKFKQINLAFQDLENDKINILEEIIRDTDIKLTEHIPDEPSKLSMELLSSSFKISIEESIDYLRLLSKKYNMSRNEIYYILMREKYKHNDDYQSKFDKKICSNEYEIIATIGSGSLGIAYYVYHKDDKSRGLVVKDQPNNYIADNEESIYKILNDTDIFPHLEKSWNCGDRKIMILEYVGQSFTQGQRLSKENSLKLVEKMRKLHKLGFTHNDMNLGNMTQFTDADGNIKYYLIDPGHTYKSSNNVNDWLELSMVAFIPKEIIDSLRDEELADLIRDQQIEYYGNQ